MAALLLAAVVLSGCPSRSGGSDRPTTAEERNASIVAIADQFTATEDLEAAQVALNALGLPAAPRAVLALAESYIATGQDTEMTLELANLAEGLGMSSRMVGDFVAAAAASGANAPVALAPPATDTPVPTETPEPTATATDTPAPSDTPTELPEPSDTPTQTPVPRPVAVVDVQMNVRGGPGTSYVILDQAQAGDELDITARSQDGNWWQVVLDNGSAGWLAASLVTASGPTGDVHIAQNVAPPPTPRPTNTPAEPATVPTDTPRPPSSTDFVIVKQRLLTIQENGGCSGNHNGFVKVIDINGNPLNGVTLKGIFQSQVNNQDGKPDELRVSGSKGSDFRGVPDEGWLQFDFFRNGDQLIVVSDVDGRPATSQTTRSLDIADEKLGPELLVSTGYCTNVEECQVRIDQNTLCRWHYSWEVVFQRQY